MAVQNRKFALDEWSRTLKAALEVDSWGQSLEASEEYEKIIRSLDAYMPHLELSAEEKNTLLKLKAACTLRVSCLSDTNGIQGIKVDQMKLLPDVLKLVFSGKPPAFPIALAKFTSELPADYDIKRSNSDISKAEADDAPANVVGSLLPPLTIKRAGVTTASIVIEKIGLKDAETYIDPRITITLVDGKGQPVGPVQETPPSNVHQDKYIQIGRTCHIQKMVEDFQEGYALFFEFKHYKPKKNKVSTRCYAFMEKDELKQGPVTLELYKKPTDFTKKNPALFSIKPLYLHLRVSLHRH